MKIQKEREVRSEELTSEFRAQPPQKANKVNGSKKNDVCLATLKFTH